MPEVRKTIGVCDFARKGFAARTATSSERESDCYLHGVFSEEKIASVLDDRKPTEKPDNASPCITEDRVSR